LKLLARDKMVAEADNLLARGKMVAEAALATK